MNLKLHFRVFLCFSVTTVSLNISQIYFAIYEYDRLLHLFWHVYYIFFKMLSFLQIGYACILQDQFPIIVYSLYHCKCYCFCKITFSNSLCYCQNYNRPLYVDHMSSYLAELLLIKFKGKKEKKCIFSLVAKTLEVMCTHQT